MKKACILIISFILLLHQIFAEENISFESIYDTQFFKFQESAFSGTYVEQNGVGYKSGFIVNKKLIDILKSNDSAFKLISTSSAQRDVSNILSITGYVFEAGTLGYLYYSQYMTSIDKPINLGESNITLLAGTGITLVAIIVSSIFRTQSSINFTKAINEWNNSLVKGR